MKSVYVRQVATLLTGGMLAQLVSLIFAPVLTRLFTPEEFGPLAMFVAIVAALVPGISGRYDVAVVVGATAKEKLNFVFIAIWLAGLLCLIFLLVLLGAGNVISEWLNAGIMGYWLLVTPFALFVTAFITVLRSYANANNEYAIISKSAVIQTTTAGVVSVTLGVVGMNKSGLLLGNLLSVVLTCSYLLYLYRHLFEGLDWRWSKSKWDQAIRYKDYLIFNAPTSVLNGVMTGLPVFFLAKYYSEGIVGCYMLLARVGVVPLSFISEAVSRVNFKTLSDKLQQGEKPIRYLIKATGVLAAIATLPTIAIMLYAPFLFALIFGEEWRLAGELLVILMPALGLQFVVSSLSLGFVAAGHLKVLAFWQIASFLLTILVFEWASDDLDIHNFFMAFAAKDIALYFLYYGLLVHVVLHPTNLREA